MKQQHVYKIEDVEHDQQQLYVFNVDIDDDGIMLESMQILINTNGVETKVTLNIAEILRNIVKNPEISLASDKNKKIITQLFEEVLDKQQNDTLEHEIDFVDLLGNYERICKISGTKHSDIVDELNAKPIDKRKTQ